MTTDPAERADPTWRPFPERDPERMRDLIADYGRRLGTAEPRVAASILYQGLAARIWSPVLAVAARGVVPDLSGLRWRWTPGAPVALWLADPARRLKHPDGSGPAAGAAELVRDVVIEGVLRPLRTTTLRTVRLADGVLWGNAASALAGALLAPVAAGSAWAVPMTALAERLLAMEPLAGAGSFGPAGFARRSCCLYYRVPPGGSLCGDCVFVGRRPPRAP